LPQFYAVNLTRLPPVTPNHCDMSLLLGEIQSLRSEVRAVSHLRDEIIDTLKEEVKVLSHLKKDVHDLQGQVRHLSTSLNNASSSTVADSTSQVPPEVTGKTSQQAAVSNHFLNFSCQNDPTPIIKPPRPPSVFPGPIQTTRRSRSHTPPARAGAYMQAHAKKRATGTPHHSIPPSLTRALLLKISSTNGIPSFGKQ